jgi:hypothetical protein
VPYHGHTRHFCKVCERPRDEGERFSARGLCPECGEQRLLDEHRQLRSSSGPHFDHWLARCRAAFGVVVVDAQRDER